MKVVIIFNPNSTGDSEENAQALRAELQSLGVSASILATEFAKHGEQIAAQYAEKDEDVILISSSGDGGYHEVVNGALSHSNQRLIVGVLPSGNANDHYSALGSDSLAHSIKEKKVQVVDTIKVTGTVEGKPWVRYAHSYVGIGVTAKAAEQLTKKRPNMLTEKWIVLHSLLSFGYVKVLENSRKRRYSSLIFNNIDRMSKVVKFSSDASITDGKFEVSSIEFHSKLRLIGYLLTAATVGLKRLPSQNSYTCQTLTPLPIQLDGESYRIDANTTLTVESVQKNLRCIL